MDESKKQLLSDIFWEMNSISSRSESHSETEIIETDDGNGNIVQTETTVTKTTLYITVSHLTVDEIGISCVTDRRRIKRILGSLICFSITTFYCIRIAQYKYFQKLNQC